MRLETIEMVENQWKNCSAQMQNGLIWFYSVLSEEGQVEDWLGFLTYIFGLDEDQERAPLVTAADDSTEL